MGTIDFRESMKLSGKLGPMIAYVSKEGKQMFRSYTKPHNPRTPKQLEQRARFSLANKALSPLRSAIKKGHPNVNNAYRKAIGNAYHEAIEGTYPDLQFNLSRIRVAEGSIPLPHTVVIHYEPALREATFGWSIQSAGDSKLSSRDKVNIVYYNTAYQEEARIAVAAERADGKATVILPEEWQPDLTHFWFFLVSRNRENASESVYFNLKERKT